MASPPGHIYARLAAAVARSGTPRSVYAQDTTLSRRGLLTRADKRARELAAAGVGERDLVALSMGNVPQLIVLLLACSKLRAIPVPVDPANGDRTLVDTAARLPLRAVVRRPRGLETSAIEYGGGYQVRSRRRLSSSLLTLDLLEPPASVMVDLPADAELVMEVRGIGGVPRDLVRTGRHLEAIGRSAVSALGIDAGARILCAQPFTVPRFFDPVVLGWLESESQLVMAEGPALHSVLPIARSYENLIVVDSLRQLLELSRALKAGGTTLPLRPIMPQSMIPLNTGRALKAAFGNPGAQLLLLEELGVLAVRELDRGARFRVAEGVELAAGAPMEVGGHEVLAHAEPAPLAIPDIPPTEPGAIADPPWRHTGYAGRFGKDGALIEVLGRDDGLVALEGRRACLDAIEEVMLEHRRVTWARAAVRPTADGDPEVHVEYRATGTTEVEDLEEHVIGRLPPFMVPRTFTRELE
jgi:acyl-CoA synthetase (AMP-forming)/AMP-acid ligase II